MPSTSRRGQNAGVARVGFICRSARGWLRNNGWFDVEAPVWAMAFNRLCKQRSELGCRADPSAEGRQD